MKGVAKARAFHSGFAELLYDPIAPTGIRPMFGPRLEVAGYKLGGEYFGLGL